MFNEKDNLINELRNILRGRSNTISKDEIKEILDKYESKDKALVDKGFWTMDSNKENKEGLIPSLINNYKFNQQFTREERLELDKLRKESYMKIMRELAKDDGEERAKKEVRKRNSK